MPRTSHDAVPPPGWPPEVTYLTSSRLSPTFPPSHLPYIRPPQPSAPSEPKHAFPSQMVKIRLITDPAHPCQGHYGLFAVKRIEPRTMVIPYLGVIHSKPADRSRTIHDDSDYDLSLLRRTISVLASASSESSNGVNGSPGVISSPNLTQSTSKTPASSCTHTDIILDIAIDASISGNAARMINDYRNIPVASGGSGIGSKVNPGEKGMNAGKLKAKSKSGKVMPGTATTSANIPTTVYATRPNVEFCLVGGLTSQPKHSTTPRPPKPLIDGHLPPPPFAEPLRMEVWTLDRSIEKGQEILLNYGKGFHAARVAG